MIPVYTVFIKQHKERICSLLIVYSLKCISELNLSHISRM